MAEKKAKVIPVETADLAPVRVKIVDKVAKCGNCNMSLVDIVTNRKCRFCWYCGKPILWK